MRVAIVGNAPLTGDHASLVDAADFVVRFNKPLSWGGRGGRRFDAWVIANGKGGRHFAVQRVFSDAPYRDLPAEIWFPRALDVHPELAADASEGYLERLQDKDFSRRILRANRLRQPVTRFDADFYRHCLTLLQEVAGDPGPVLVPSAGFMALNHVLRRFPAAGITMIGFTFQGWPGHPWDLEREFTCGLAARGQVDLIPT